MTAQITADQVIRKRLIGAGHFATKRLFAGQLERLGQGDFGKLLTAGSANHTARFGNHGAFQAGFHDVLVPFKDLMDRDK